MFLSTIKYKDTDDLICEKIDYVARYIETFALRRAVNFKKFGQSAIRYTMFNIIKSIRGGSLNKIGNILKKELEKQAETWEGVYEFSMHQQNKWFVKHLLCRITGFLDEELGRSTKYENYINPAGKAFEIEHMMTKKFKLFNKIFSDEKEFDAYRNSLGAMILIPNGTNQSFKSDKYEEKLEHYFRENSLAQTLHPLFYKKNPAFLNSPVIKKLNFKPMEEILIANIDSRIELVKNICEEIWSIDYFVAE